MRMITLDQQARALGSTPDKVAALMLRNAAAMRLYTAKDLKRAGKTRAQMNTIADNYEARANAR